MICVVATPEALAGTIRLRAGSGWIVPAVLAAVGLLHGLAIVWLARTSRWVRQQASTQNLPDWMVALAARNLGRTLPLAGLGALLALAGLAGTLALGPDPQRPGVWLGLWLLNGLSLGYTLAAAGFEVVSVRSQARLLSVVRELTRRPRPTTDPH